MILHSAFPIVFNFLPQKPIVVEVSNEALSKYGGLVQIHQFDEHIGFTRLIAEQPARGKAISGSNLRRLHSSWREREP
jgi:hypothetical protein